MSQSIAFRALRTLPMTIKLAGWDGQAPTRGLSAKASVTAVVCRHTSN
jgi:hypothetical protein